MEIDIMEIKANIIVGKEIKFDPYQGSHSINSVLNSLQVPLFPSAIITNVMIKMLLPTNDYLGSVHMDVVAPDQIIVTSCAEIDIKNYRSAASIPGMDACIQLRFAVTEEGNYFYRLMAYDKVITEYPLFISLSESRI
jgi:hypothetical protein